MLYWDVLRMSYFKILRAFVEDILRTSVRNVPWLYIQKHMGTLIGCLLRTCSGCPWDIILPSGKRGMTFLGDFQFLHKTN